MFNSVGVHHNCPQPKGERFESTMSHVMWERTHTNLKLLAEDTTQVYKVDTGHNVLVEPRKDVITNGKNSLPAKQLLFLATLKKL